MNKNFATLVFALCFGIGFSACNVVTGDLTPDAGTITSVGPICTDGLRNGNESDVDCGGSCGATCDLGRACVHGNDCRTGVCENNACVTPKSDQPTCVDGKKNGIETDVDCGGTMCVPCTVGKVCLHASDCTTLLCENNTCRALPDMTVPPDMVVPPDMTVPPDLAPSPDLVQPSCRNSIKDGNETDVDCGGNCAQCVATKRCIRDADCLNGGCFIDTCYTEIGFPCGADDECVSGFCANKICALHPVSCRNGIKDGNETDVDCGGNCVGCDTGRHCNGGFDCWSGVCTNNLCIAANCFDRVMNGFESDVDCGFSCGGNCVNGKECRAGNDCASKFCVGGVCQSPPDMAGNDMVVPPDMAPLPQPDMASPPQDFAGIDFALVCQGQRSLKIVPTSFNWQVWTPIAFDPNGQRISPNQPNGVIKQCLDQAWRGYVYFSAYNPDPFDWKQFVHDGGPSGTAKDAGFDIWLDLNDGVGERQMNVVTPMCWDGVSFKPQIPIDGDLAVAKCR